MNRLEVNISFNYGMDIIADNYTDYKRKQQFIGLTNDLLYIESLNEVKKNIKNNILAGVLVDMIFNYVGDVINILLSNEIPENSFIYWTLYKKIGYDILDNASFLSMNIRYVDCLGSKSLLYYKLSKFRYQSNPLCSFQCKDICNNLNDWPIIEKLIKEMKEIFIYKIFDNDLKFNIYDCSEDIHKYLNEEENNSLISTIKNSIVEICRDSHHCYYVCDCDYDCEHKLITPRYISDGEYNIPNIVNNKYLYTNLGEYGTSSPEIILMNGLTIEDIENNSSYARYPLYEYDIIPVMFIKKIQLIFKDHLIQNFNLVVGIKQLHIEQIDYVKSTMFSDKISNVINMEYSNIVFI